LYAYDATNLANVLYNSNQAANYRDVPGAPVSFTTPTVANGKVYVGSIGSVEAYGLLNGVAPTASAPSFSPAAGTYTSSQSVTLSDATPNATIYYTTNGSAPTTASTKYTTPLTIGSTTTINALAVASGYGNSAVTAATYTITPATPPPASGTTPVALGSAANVTGIYANGSTDTSGGLDGNGDALSATLLGTSITTGGITFNVGNTGAADAASNSVVALPAGNYTTLNLLAAAVNGNQTNQQFVVTYTDGTTSSFTQSLSDWYTPQNFAGESKAVTMAYTLLPNGTTRPGPYYLYAYAFTINSAKTVKSVTLPANRNVVLVGATLSGEVTTSPSAPTAVTLAGVANIRGLFNDGSPVLAGGMDTFGNAYSKTLLGSTLTWSGDSFTFGSAGVADATYAATVPLPAGNFSAVKLLGTGIKGNHANQVFTVTYTDGTTTVITQGLSDWLTPQNYSGEANAATMAYLLNASGAKLADTVHLYGYSFAINGAKTVKSITLPNTRDVVILALDLVPAD